jgi:Trp operon repressor
MCYSQTHKANFNVYSMKSEEYGLTLPLKRENETPPQNDASEMEHLSSDMEQQQNQQVQWRRDKVQELGSKGYSQREISRVLQVGLATVNRDISYLRNQAKSNIKRYIDERLPEEYEKCLVGLNAITKEAWNTAANTEDKREKIQALSLAKECYSMKLASIILLVYLLKEE